MSPISQLIIVIAIIVLFLYLVNKVIKLVVKLTLIIIGAMVIFSVVSLFLIQNQIGELGTENVVLVLMNKTTPLTILQSSSNKISFLNEVLDEEFDPKELNFNSTVLVIDQEVFKKNETVYEKLKEFVSEEDSEKIYSAIMDFINQTSFIKLTYLYFKRDIKVYPKAKINSYSPTLKNTSSFRLKILKLVRI